jgi:hypothetical protein
MFAGDSTTYTLLSPNLWFIKTLSRMLRLCLLIRNGYISYHNSCRQNILIDQPATDIYRQVMWLWIFIFDWTPKGERGWAIHVHGKGFCEEWRVLPSWVNIWHVFTQIGCVQSGEFMMNFSIVLSLPICCTITGCFGNVHWSSSLWS